MRRNFLHVITMFGALSLALHDAQARPTALGTAFTYQGQLKQSGSPVNSTADFQFLLWDALSGGSQVGSTASASNVTISSGMFTVQIDFGSNVFDGNARWLEIGVRSPAGGGSFTTLSPRQPLTAAPYALQARGIFVDSANNVGIGTSSPSNRLTVSNETDNNSIIAINSGATAAQFSTLRLNDQGTAVWSVSKNPSNDFTIREVGVPADRFYIAQGGNVGIGTSSPAYPLQVVGFSDRAIFGRSTATAGFNAGVYGQTDSHNGNGVWGEATTTTGPNNGVIGSSASTSGAGVYATASAASGTTYGVLSICSSGSGYDFYADGAGINYGAPSSIRWKRDIEPIGQPLEMIAQMRGVYFDWDEKHGGHHDVGMIGEEVGKVLPEIVAYEADGQYVTGMDYSKLTPLLVEAVKALRAEKDAQLDQQQQQMDSLKSENAELRKQLKTLENQVRLLAEQQQRGAK